MEAAQSPHDARSRISRRSFLKYGAIGGLAAFGAASAYVYPSGWKRWIEYGQKPWELARGVVDYDLLKKYQYGPSELGFENDIRNSPPEARILNVAQWYDYWPGKVLLDFGVYMQKRWGLRGVQVSWTSNVYTANEELFTWVTQTGRRFDLMFPTNYNVEALEKAGHLVNLNKDWLPNYANIFGTVPPPGEIPPDRDETYFEQHPESPPLPYQPSYPIYPNGYNNTAGVDFRDPMLNGYAYRMNRNTYAIPRGAEYFTWDEKNSAVAVAYHWGTTGIGYRTDVFDRADLEQLGWEVFELPSYTNSRGETYDLRGKKMLLDDMREVFTAALKAVGWKRQDEDPGIPLPTAVPGANGDYQWSSNETAEEKLSSAADWLRSLPGMWGFNTPQQGPWLVSRTMLVDMAWNGDIMYAIRPNSNQHLPVDYVVPKQGGARWLDNSAIHRESDKIWLCHEFMNYLLDPQVGVTLAQWNLYATPHCWTFELLQNDPTNTFVGRYPDGSPYAWNQTWEDVLYSDIAVGYDGPPILERSEYQRDVGVKDTLRYFSQWRHVKF